MLLKNLVVYQRAPGRGRHALALPGPPRPRRRQGLGRPLVEGARGVMGLVVVVVVVLLLLLLLDVGGGSVLLAVAPEPRVFLCASASPRGGVPVRGLGPAPLALLRSLRGPAGDPVGPGQAWRRSAGGAVGGFVMAVHGGVVDQRSGVPESGGRVGWARGVMWVRGVG